MIGKALAAILARLLLSPKRAPDFLIGGTKDDPYMRRWWIIPRNRFFNIYLHQMLHDDDDRALHDHPWWSLSLCLRGVIGEVYADGKYHCTRMIRRGKIVPRSGRAAHRLTLPEGEAWTLFITGPRFREWGFHCPKGWLHWSEFVSKDDIGSIGRGCGEADE